MGDSGDAATAVRDIEDIGIDRLTDTIAAAWAALGADEDGPRWPADERRYRLELSAPEEPVGLDALAATLDASPRTPTRAFVHLGLGRRDDPGGERYAVETLAGHTRVSATETHTTGTVPLTDETFDALARISGDTLVYALICDDDGRAVAERDWTTLTVSVPDSALDSVSDAVGPTVAERFERA